MRNLTKAIESVERRIETRKRLLSLEYDVLRLSVKKQLASPKSIIGAFVGGTALAYFARKKKSKGGSRSASPFRLWRQANSIVQTATKYIAILLPLKKWLEGVAADRASAKAEDPNRASENYADNNNYEQPKAAYRPTVEDTQPSGTMH